MPVPSLESFDIPQYSPSEIMKESLINAQKRNSQLNEDDNAIFNKNNVPYIKLIKPDDVSNECFFLFV